MAATSVATLRNADRSPNLDAAFASDAEAFYAFACVAVPVAPVSEDFEHSIVGIFLNRKNIIILLMAIELMLLAVTQWQESRE